MIEKAALPLNVPHGPSAAGIMVDPRTNQILYNPDGTLQYLPALVKLSTDTVSSTETTQTIYQSVTIAADCLSPGRVLTLTHFGSCAATAGTKTQFIQVGAAVVANTGAVANNGGTFRLRADLIIVSPTHAIASGEGLSAQSARNQFMACAIDIAEPLVIGFGSINPAVGDTLHGGYLVQLIG
jgi:hypothetical protein